MAKRRTEDNISKDIVIVVTIIVVTITDNELAADLGVLLVLGVVDRAGRGFGLDDFGGSKEASHLERSQELVRLYFVYKTK